MVFLGNLGGFDSLVDGNFLFDGELWIFDLADSVGLISLKRDQETMLINSSITWALALQLHNGETIAIGSNR